VPPAFCFVASKNGPLETPQKYRFEGANIRGYLGKFQENPTPQLRRGVLRHFPVFIMAIFKNCP
jgi:hypothetical protein